MLFWIDCPHKKRLQRESYIYTYIYIHTYVHTYRMDALLFCFLSFFAISSSSPSPVLSLYNLSHSLYKTKFQLDGCDTESVSLHVRGVNRSSDLRHYRMEKTDRLQIYTLLLTYPNTLKLDLHTISISKKTKTGVFTNGASTSRQQFLHSFVRKRASSNKNLLLSFFISRSVVKSSQH
jgi:hypothetical protein